MRIGQRKTHRAESAAPMRPGSAVRHPAGGARQPSPCLWPASWLRWPWLGMQAVAAVEQDLPSLEAQGDVHLAQTTADLRRPTAPFSPTCTAGENRTVISGKQIPDVLRHALVAIEDERFYNHNGVDFEGFVRALVANIQSQGIDEGFSTITMQLVGNLYLDRTDISLTRKFNEMALAWQFERKYSKNEILDMYLNTVFFGSNAYGSRGGRPHLLRQGPRGSHPRRGGPARRSAPGAHRPTRPRRHPEAALKRRNMVLDKMYELGFITDDRVPGGASTTPLELAPYSPYTKVQEPYVVAYVRKQLIDMFGEEKVFKGGLRVETTINPDYQKLATDAISSTLNEEGDPSAALVSIETKTGYIRAMVGGSDYDTSKFNLASQGRRQPGSAFKTFVPGRRHRDGHRPLRTPTTSRSLSPSRIPAHPKPWKVKTYGGSYYGTSTVAPGHPAQRQHRVRADGPRRGRRADRRRRPAHGHHLGAQRRTRPSPWAASSTACRRWRWPRPTPPWPTAGSTSSRPSSCGSRTPTAT